MKSVPLCPSVQLSICICASLQAARITHAGSGTEHYPNLPEAQEGIYMNTTIKLCLPNIVHFVSAQLWTTVKEKHTQKKSQTPAQFGL